MATRLMTVADLFGADLSVFWDPFDTSTITQSAGSISQLGDESVAGGARPSGTPVNASQSTAAKQPTYSATGLAGKPAFRGNGSQYFDIAPVTGLPTGQSDVTMFALMQGFDGTGANANQVVLSWGSSGNGVEHLFGYNNNGPYWWYTDRGGGSGDFHGSTDLTAAPSLCILTLDATGSNLAVEMRVNSVVEASGTGSAASFGSDGGRLLYTINDYCHPANVAAGAVGVVRRTLTLDEKQKLEGILLWRQGIQTSSGGPLPSSHPYYAAAPTVSTGGGATYALAAAAGSIVLTGRAASRAVRRAVSSAAFTLTGRPAAQTQIRPATQASFTLTGRAAGQSQTRSASPGSLTVTGQPIAQGHIFTLASNGGSVAVTGRAAARSLARFGSVATFTVTGIASAKVVGRQASGSTRMVTGGASSRGLGRSTVPAGFTVTGLSAARALNLAAPSTAPSMITGRPTSFASGRFASPGAFVLNGVAAGLRSLRGLTAGPGTIGTTGFASGYTNSHVSGYTLGAGSGQYGVRMFGDGSAKQLPFMKRKRVRFGLSTQ